jgi:hypothetical protein
MKFKTFEEYKQYSFLAKSTRHEMNIFDVDDTLIVTKAAIIVTDNETGKIIKLTPQEFNEYETNSRDSLDFSDFANLEILKAGKIIDWVFKILRQTLAKGKAVGIITARSDSKMIYDFLLYNGVKINREFIFAVNDPKLKLKGSISNRKKEALRKLISKGFTTFKFFDDSKENLTIAKSLESEYKDVKIKTKYIKQEWIPKIK